MMLSFLVLPICQLVKCNKSRRPTMNRPSGKCRQKMSARLYSPQLVNWNFESEAIVRRTETVYLNRIVQKVEEIMIGNFVPRP